MRILIAAITAASLSGPVAAESSNYFFEGVFGGGAGNIKVDEPGEPEVTFNRASVDLTINLGSVSTYNIPYNESQFLNRSSYIGFSQENVASEDSEDVISREVRARYVTGSGLYFAAIGDIDSEETDNSTYEVQLGKFTDASNSMFIGYVIDSLDNVDTFTAGIHHTSPYVGEDSWLAYDFGGRYMIEGEDNEYAVNIGMAYYPSLRSSLGVWYEYADGRLTDSHETNVYGEYYFSHRFSARADFTAIRLGNVDENAAGMSLKLRF